MRLFISTLLLLVSVAVSQPRPENWPIGARIPAISGRVVDAITRKPVANVDVTLRVKIIGDNKLIRYENQRSSRDGGFNFASTLHPEAAQLLTTIEEYWLTVNEAFNQEWSGNGDVSWGVIGDPLFNQKPNASQLPAGAIPNPSATDRAYFPLGVHFLRSCHQHWNANCIQLPETPQITVPLIPTLDHPEQCTAIAEPSLADKCRQINIYRAAFLHLSSIGEVRSAKALCRQLDNGSITEECTKGLHGHLQNPSPSNTDFDPAERVLILHPISNLDPRRAELISRDPFLERALYGVAYGLPRELAIDTVHVNVIVTPDRNQEIQDQLRRQGENYKPGMERREMIEGSPVTALDLPKINIVLWPSRDRVVLVTFYTPALYSNLGEEHARAAVATPSTRLEILRQYLLKYPPDR